MEEEEEKEAKNVFALTPQRFDSNSKIAFKKYCVENTMMNAKAKNDLISETLSQLFVDWSPCLCL